MRSMNNLTHEDAQKSGWEIVKPLNCEVVGKATFEEVQQGTGLIRIMKSTKRFRVPGGWIYNTSTEYQKNSQVSVAEALVFVPETKGGDTEMGEELTKMTLDELSKSIADGVLKVGDKVEIVTPAGEQGSDVAASPGA